MSQANQPEESPAEATLSVDEQRLLTDARTVMWKLESYEFAYDAHVRSLNFKRTLLDFLAVLIAVVFLFLQYLVKDKNAVAHEVLGYVATGLSIAVILTAIWGAFSRWTDQIEKKQSLSRNIRDLLVGYGKVVEIRPVDQGKIRSWIRKATEFEEERKHVLAEVSRYFLKRGYQHMANSHPDQSVVCSMCGKEWRPELNRKTRWTWIPFYGCSNCGV